MRPGAEPCSRVDGFVIGSEGGPSSAARGSAGIAGTAQESRAPRQPLCRSRDSARLRQASHSRLSDRTAGKVTGGLSPERFYEAGRAHGATTPSRCLTSSSTWSGLDTVSAISARSSCPNRCAQPVDRRLHGTLGGTELRRHLSIGRLRLRCRSGIPRAARTPGPGPLLLLPPQPAERALEHGERPPAFEDLFGRQPVRRLVPVAAPRRPGFEREQPRCGRRASTPAPSHALSRGSS